MPELQLSISFPNLTSDGYPVLYPTGWSSSDVSPVCFSKGVNSVTFFFFFKNHSYLLILYWGGGMSVAQGRSEGHLQQSVLSFYTVGPAAGWLRASGLAASAFRQRPGDRTRVTGLAVSTFHLLRHLSNPLLPSSPPALYDTRDK